MESKPRAFLLIGVLAALLGGIAYLGWPKIAPHLASFKRSDLGSFPSPATQIALDTDLDDDEKPRMSREAEPTTSERENPSTPPPHGIKIDSPGHATYSRLTRDMFEYFLSGIKVSSANDAKAKILAHLATIFDAESVKLIEPVVDQYIAYKKDLALAINDRRGGITPEELLELNLSEQEKHFSSDVADVFFGYDRTYDAYMVAKLSILRDEGMLDEEKKAKIAELDRSLPDDIREDHEKATQIQRWAEQMEAFKKSGAGEAELAELREAKLGRSASRRLATLDREQAEWQERLKEFLLRKQEILASGSEDSEAEIQALLESSFSANERKRVQVLTRQ